MALELNKNGIEVGEDILPGHVTQSIDALTGNKEYDITISGSLSLKGTTSTPQDDVLTINTQTGKIHHTSKTDLAPDPTIPNLQEVTTKGNTTNQDITIDGSLYLKGTTSTSQDDVLTINTQTGQIHHISKTDLAPDPTTPDLQEVTAEGNTTNQDITIIGGTLTSANFKHTGKSVHFPNVPGWYTILSFNASSKRGGGNLILSTTGGDFRPTTWVIKYHDDWGSGGGSKGTLKLEQYGTGTQITKARIISDQNSPNDEHLEIYINNSKFDGREDSEESPPITTNPPELSYHQSLVIYDDKLLGYAIGISLNIETITPDIWDTDSNSVQTVNVETLKSSTFDTNNGDTLIKELDFITQGTSMENLLVKSLTEDTSIQSPNVTLYDTTSGQFYYTSSNAFGGGDSLWTVDSSNSNQINYEGFIAPSIKNTNSSSIAIGHEALKANGTKVNNIGIGKLAGTKSTGQCNIFIGHENSKNKISGDYNTIIGPEIFLNNQISNWNTILGYKIAPDKTISHKNVYLGANINSSTNASTENEIIIGYGATGIGSHSVRLGNSTIKNIEGNVTFVAASDQRIKENITDYKLGLDFIKLLSPKNFTKVNPADYPEPILEERFTGDNPEDRPNDDPDTYDGLIAQEVKSALDSLLESSKIHNINENGMQGISYSLLVLPLINAVKALSDKIDAIETQLNSTPSPSPSITSITPLSANQGERKSITITGANLEPNTWNEDTILDFGDNIYGIESTSINGDEITFIININNNATPGNYNIGTKGDANGTLTYGSQFEIVEVQQDPELIQMTPSSAEQGETVTITFTGQNLNEPFNNGTQFNQLWNTNSSVPRIFFDNLGTTFPNNNKISFELLIRDQTDVGEYTIGTRGDNNGDLLYSGKFTITPPTAVEDGRPNDETGYTTPDYDFIVDVDSYTDPNDGTPSNKFYLEGSGEGMFTEPRDYHPVLPENGTSRYGMNTQIRIYYPNVSGLSGANYTYLDASHPLIINHENNASENADYVTVEYPNNTNNFSPQSLLYTINVPESSITHVNAGSGRIYYFCGNHTKMGGYFNVFSVTPGNDGEFGG